MDGALPLVRMMNTGRLTGHLRSPAPGPGFGPQPEADFRQPGDLQGLDRSRRPGQRCNAARRLNLLPEVRRAGGYPHLRWSIMKIDLKQGQHLYAADDVGGTLMIDLYEIDNAKFRAAIMPDPDNIDLNGFDIGGLAFIFSVNDRDNTIPGTDIVLHYDPQL